MNRLVAIVGPTAVGKSSLALRLAELFNGEIVSADSRQVYRYLDIGTAKPSEEALSRIAHHLIGIVDPGEDFGLARYQGLAYRAIEDIHQRNRLPILVGGTGMYVWAVVEGWSVPPVAPDPELRHSLEARAARRGKDALYLELAGVDPAAAQKIDPRNVRRVIRAIEVYRRAGALFSQLQIKEKPLYDTLIIGLTLDRVELYRRIDLRVDEMVRRGLVDEVRRLEAMGYRYDLPAMSGIGYKQVGQYLRGELGLAEAVAQIKHETHRLARHQYSWFRLKDDRIRWFGAQDGAESRVVPLVRAFTGGQNSTK